MCSRRGLWGQQPLDWLLGVPAHKCTGVAGCCPWHYSSFGLNWVSRYPLQLPGYSGRLTPLTDSLIAGMVVVIRPVCVGHSELSDADSSLVSQFLRGAQRLTVCRPGHPVPPSSLAPFSVLILNHRVGLEGSVSSMLCWAIGIAVGGCRTGKGWSSCPSLHSCQRH